jgi:hypothetical protein
MKEYFTLSAWQWLYIIAVLLIVFWFLYSCIKDEKDYRKGLKKRPEPDESSSCVRYQQNETNGFHITDDPGLIQDDTIMFTN